MMRRRYNGSRAALVSILVQHGLSEADAERVAPKKDSFSPRHALTPEQLHAFNVIAARVADPALRTLLLLLPLTGLRVSEACHLRVADMKLNSRGRLIVGVLGKGQKWREVPLRRHGSALVAAYLKSARALPADGRLWRIGAARVQAACRLIGPAIGVPDLTPHWLRHTFATRSLMAGWLPGAIQGVMGHGKAGSKRLPAVTLTYLDV